MNLESKARINSLISAANATTGKADTDLTSAVGALIAGFGQGGNSGGASGISAISMGEVTYSDRQTKMTVEHGLGVKPDAIFMYAPGFTFPADTVHICGFFWVGYPQRISASNTRESSAVCFGTSLNYDGFTPQGIAVTVTENDFVADRPSSVYYYQPGITYRWCAVKFAEV